MLMQTKKIIITFFLILSNNLFSQQVTKDSLTSENIPFVEIYSDKGDLIGLSNESGIISPELSKKIYLSNSKKITFVHFSFKKKVVELEYYKKSTFLTLTSNSIVLNEVIIANLPPKKYLKLKGYFRSSQINEDRVQYYIDGIVEYYISTVSDKVKMKIISHRTFENKNIKQLSKRYYFLLAGVPMFNDFFNFNNLSNEYDLEINDKKTIKIIDKKEHKSKGVISNQIDNLTSLQIEITSNDNPKIMKFLGMESHLNNYNIASVYDTSESKNISLKKIIYFKEIREYEIKRKKKDNFTNVDVIHEFFLFDKKYTNDQDSSDFDDFYSFKNNSYYNENYWDSIPNIVYQSLPNSFETDIKNNLKENKNTFLKN